MNKFVVLCFVALTLAVAQARLNTNLHKVLARSMLQTPAPVAAAATTTTTPAPYFLVDVGSSGTRLKVAIPSVAGVKDCGDKGDALAAAAEAGSGVDTIVKGLYDSCLNKNKGELYLGNIVPALAGKDETAVKNYMKTMKIFYLATAGARQTEDAMVKATKQPEVLLWGAVKTAHDQYTGTTNNCVATTIGGQFEGIFAWRALQLVRSDLSKTVYIEQGGASQQIVFEDCAATGFLETESEGPMSVLGVNAYSKSFLGDGLNRLFRAVLKLALDDAIAANKKTTPVAHPCIGGKGSIVKGGSTYSMVIDGESIAFGKSDVKDISDSGITSLLDQFTPDAATKAVVTGSVDVGKCAALVARVFAGKDEHYAPLDYASEIGIVKTKLAACTGAKAKTNVVFSTNALVFATPGAFSTKTTTAAITAATISSIPTDYVSRDKKPFAVLGALVQAFSTQYLKEIGLSSATVEAYQCDWVVGFRQFYEALPSDKVNNLVNALGYKNNKGLTNDVEDLPVTITSAL